MLWWVSGSPGCFSSFIYTTFLNLNNFYLHLTHSTDNEIEALRGMCPSDIVRQWQMGLLIQDDVDPSPSHLLSLWRRMLFSNLGTWFCLSAYLCLLFVLRPGNPTTDTQPVLISQGSCCKLLQTWQLKTEIYSLIILEDSNPKSRCQQGNAASELWGKILLCLFQLLGVSWLVAE